MGDAVPLPFRAVPTTNQLIRKGRKAPRKKVATPGLKSGQGRKARVAAPQRRGANPGREYPCARFIRAGEPELDLPLEGHGLGMIQEVEWRRVSGEGWRRGLGGQVGQGGPSYPPHLPYRPRPTPSER